MKRCSTWWSHGRLLVLLLWLGAGPDWSALAEEGDLARGEPGWRLFAEDLGVRTEANPDDPVVRAKALELGAAVEGLYAFVRDSVAYEAYTGSLRGARGTLLSKAGNSLDQASLLLALLQVHGIQGTYIHGRLPEEAARRLIRSMFDPALAADAIGYVPDLFDRAQPEQTPGLLPLVREHWWIELEDGTALDPSFVELTPGQTRGTKLAAFDTVPEELRHTVTVRLRVEFHNPMSQYTHRTPLEAVLPTAGVYGRVLTLGHLVSQHQSPALVTGWKTYTYSPYLMVEELQGDLDRNHLIRGENYQEFLTGLFPLANSTLTRLTLEFQVRSPDRAPDIRQWDLLDRVGCAARKGLAPPGAVDTRRPALTELDLASVLITPGWLPGTAVETRRQLAEVLLPPIEALSDHLAPLQELDPAEWTAEQTEWFRRGNYLHRQALAQGLGSVAAVFLAYSDERTREMARHRLVRLYYDSPRITIAYARLGMTEDFALASVRLGLDLRRNVIGGLPYPGQNQASVFFANMAKGRRDTVLEHAVARMFLSGPEPSGGDLQEISAVTGLLAAAAQAVPFQRLHSGADIAPVLEQAALPAEARARISDALAQRRAVYTPVRPAWVAGQPTIAWYEIDRSTGESVGVTEDGGHQTAVENFIIWGLVSVTGAGIYNTFEGTIRDLLFKLKDTLRAWSPADDAVGEAETYEATVPVQVDLHDWGSSGAAGDPGDANLSDVEYADSLLAPIFLTASTPDATSGVVSIQGRFRLETVADPRFVANSNQRRLPSAFRARMTYDGDADHERAVVVLRGGAPEGWDLLVARETNVIPAGVTGEVSLFLRPREQTPLPGTGELVHFTVEVEFLEGVAAPDNRLVQNIPFGMPTVSQVTLTADPLNLYLSPQGVARTVLTLMNAGNTTESVNLELALPPGFEAEVSDSPLTLDPGATAERIVTFTCRDRPVGTEEMARLVASFGPNANSVDWQLAVVVPGALPAMAAAQHARALGRTALATALEGLGLDLSRLYAEPADAIRRSRALTYLGAALNEFGDALLAPYAGALRAVADELAAAAPASIPPVLEDLGAALGDLAERLTLMAAHDSEIRLIPTTGTAYAGMPIEFGVFLRNRGGRTTTYELALSDLPGRVTGSLNSSLLTLGPGESAAPWIEGHEPVIASILQPDELLAEMDFELTARAVQAPEVIRAARGSVSARREWLSLVGVEVSPPFVNAGEPVVLTARLWNAVNRPGEVEVNWWLRDPEGAPVLQGTPVWAALSVLNTIDSVGLGTVDTSGLDEGLYQVEVTLTGGPGAGPDRPSAAGHLLVGSPIGASLTAAPLQVLPGASSVAVTLGVGSTVDLGPPGIRLLGAVDTAGAGENVAVNAGFAYVGGKTHCAVVDVRDPSHPLLVRTFGDRGTVQGNRVAIVGNVLLVAFELELHAYGLADPASPRWLGKRVFSDVHGTSGFYFERHGNLALINTDVSFRDEVLQLEGIRGDTLLFDVGDPLNATFEGLLFNTPHDYRPDWPGSDYFIGQDAATVGNTLYLPSTTATGFAQGGTGSLMILAADDPRQVTPVGAFEIPETTVLYGIGTSGTQGLAIGGTGPFTFLEGTTFPTGDYRIAVLDLSHPRQPALAKSLLVPELKNLTRAPDLNSGIQITGGPHGLYALRRALWQDEAALVLVNAATPEQLSVYHVPAASMIHGAQFDGSLLYTVGASGLTIHEIGGIVTIPTQTQVRIAEATAQDLTDFSLDPDRVIEEPGAVTLVWQLPVSATQPTNTVLWRTTLDGIVPGQSLQLIEGGHVSYTAWGRAAEIPLPTVTVVAEQLLTLNPPRQTAAPGEVATFELTLRNPTPDPLSLNLTLHGVPEDWGLLPANVAVPAAGQTELPLLLHPDAHSAEGSRSFVVGADTGNGLSGSAGGELILAGRWTPPPTRGLAIELPPASPIAGPGTTATCVIRLVNTGEITESIILSVVTPEDVSWQGAPVSLDLVPGLDNDRKIPLSLVPDPDAAPGNKPFSVIARRVNESDAGAVANGILEVLPRGVALSVTPQRALLGTPLTVSLANPGPTAEIYDLRLGGILASVAQLQQTEVALGPGGEATVTVSFAESDFALPGDLSLWIEAILRGEERLRAQARAVLDAPETAGLEACFNPERSERSEPGADSTCLQLRNRGNVEESITLHILNTTGPLLAGFRSLDGSLTNTIAMMHLPALGTAVCILDATLTAFGQGTVTVGITSARHPGVMTQAVASFQTTAGFTLRRTDGIELTFTPIPGLTHQLEYRGTLDPPSPWVELPGGPHDAGYHLDRNPSPMRFYRLRLSDSATLPISIRAAAETELTWSPASGMLYTVQYLDEPTSDPVWRDLPNAPHLGGRVIDPSPRPYRFYRLRITPSN